MAVNGKLEGISVADLYAVGDRNDVPGYRRVVAEVRAVVADWPRFAEEADVDGHSIKAVAEDIEAVAPR